MELSLLTSKREPKYVKLCTVSKLCKSIMWGKLKQEHCWNTGKNLKPEVVLGCGETIL
jgi:hypothetical protein